MLIDHTAACNKMNMEDTVHHTQAAAASYLHWQSVQACNFA